MTTPPERPDRDWTPPSETHAEVSDLLGLSQLIAAGVIDVVPGDPPVPITVWRVADPDERDGADGFTGRTAQLLVGLYTDPGDTIVSLHDDPALHGAAGAGARRYLPVDTPADLADLDHVAGTVHLVVLPWPPTGHPHAEGGEPDSGELIDLFTACRLLLAPDGYTVVAITPATSGPDYAQYVRLLVPAARRAGLGWLEHIIAITAPIVGDHIGVPAAPADPATIRTPRDLQIHIDLYVFVIRVGRHG
jgi:hypothetical protein